MRPNKHLTSKWHNHNVSKQFIRSQTNTRPANVTITMLSNNLMQPNTQTTRKRHNVIKQFTQKYSKCHNQNAIIKFIHSKKTHDLQMSQSTQCYQIVYMQPKKHTSSKCHNHNIIKQFLCSLTNTLLAYVTITMLSSSLYAAKQTQESQWYHTTYISQTNPWPSNGRWSKLQMNVECMRTQGADPD